MHAISNKKTSYNVDETHIITIPSTSQFQFLGKKPDIIAVNDIDTFVRPTFFFPCKQFNKENLMDHSPKGKGLHYWQNDLLCLAYKAFPGNQDFRRFQWPQMSQGP